jgi:hypothetical protein
MKDDLISRLRNRRALLSRHDGSYIHTTEPDPDCQEAADALEMFYVEQQIGELFERVEALENALWIPYRSFNQTKRLKAMNKEIRDDERENCSEGS